MSSLSLTGLKSNTQIMSDSLLNVQDIKMQDTSFGSRCAGLVPELLIGVPITAGIVTFPYWKNYAAHPFTSIKNVKKPNIDFHIKSNVTKASNWLKNKTGYTGLKTGVANTQRGASALRLAKSGFKGMGIFAAISGILEIPNLISAYQIDKAEKANGNSSNHLGKQAVKSTVKVGSGVLGYALGSAAAGAVAGTVFPGLGNVAGAIIGFVGGCVGGMLAGYAADKVVGEHTEAEEYTAKLDAQNKEKSNILAKEAETNSQTKEQLLSAVYQKIQSGEITDKSVIEAFEKEAAAYSNNQPSTQVVQNEQVTDEYSTLLMQLQQLKNLRSSSSIYYNA